VNARANVCALKQVGCTELFSLSAAGSLREDYPPGTFVLVDQFIDRTFARPKTFFGDGLVAHVSIARPVCPRLQDVAEAAARELGIPVARGGTYVVMEGPQFSTRAESDLHRDFGASIIGMTAMPEAKLAREAELCYAIAAIVTDYDCWREADGAVTADVVAETMRALGERAAALVRAVARMLPPRGDEPCPHGCDRALDGAVMTDPGTVAPEVRRRLEPIVRRVAGDRW
jgi:5'-methylthioadenosine phosphorylase